MPAIAPKAMAWHTSATAGVTLPPKMARSDRGASAHARSCSAVIKKTSTQKKQRQ
jgi:hypothetical protein